MPRLGSLSESRILERLADEGWHDELLSHRQDYVKSIIRVEGAYVAAPLTEKGTSAYILGEHEV